MVPPRATKTPSHTLIAQSTTRTGARQSQKESIEQAEDLHEPTNTQNSDPGEEDTGEVEPEGSQSTSEGALEQLMVKMIIDQRKRLAVRKQTVTQAYSSSRDELEHSINTAFDQHKQQLSSAHRARLKRLHDLLVRKASIEAVMANQLVGLQKAYDAHSRDVESVISHQLKEMK